MGKEEITNLPDSPNEWRCNFCGDTFEKAKSLPAPEQCPFCAGMHIELVLTKREKQRHKKKNK